MIPKVFLKYMFQKLIFKSVFTLYSVIASSKLSKFIDCHLMIYDLPKLLPGHIGFYFMYLSNIQRVFLMIYDSDNLPKLLPGHPGFSSPPNHNLPLLTLLPLPPSQLTHLLNIVQTCELNFQLHLI